MSPLDQLTAWPVQTAAAAVVDADGILDSCGPDTLFAWASVTKLLTALTVLESVQRAVVDLDEPAGPPGSTVRHLLANASGIAPDDDATLARPGRRRSYSNRGFEVLAEFVAEAARPAFPGLAGVLPGFGRQDPND